MSVTMLALARYTLKGPYQAALVVGLLAVLAVFVPPLLGYAFPGLLLAILFNLLATVLVGLIILTQGSASGLKAIVISVLGVSLVAWIVLKSPNEGISMALVQWLPVVILAQVLRSSKSLALMLIVGVCIGLFGIAVQYMVWGDLAADWLAQLSQHNQEAGRLKDEEIQAIGLSLQLMMHILVPCIFVLSTLVVLMARWIQAKLATSNGFGKEFQALALGKSTAMVGLLTVVLFFTASQPWMISLALLIVMAFMFQGIAVVHNRLKMKRRPLALFVLFYSLLVVTWTITGILTSIAGMIDNWLDFRNKPGPNDLNEL